MLMHFGFAGKAPCQIEKTTTKIPPVTGRYADITCKNCRSLVGRPVKQAETLTRPIHLRREDSTWCTSVSGTTTDAIAKVNCDDCFFSYRRKLGMPRGARGGRRTG